MSRIIAEQHSVASVGVPYIHDQPLKTRGAEIIAPELLVEHGQQVAACLTPIDYQAVRGTCMDERMRLRLRNGQPAEIRPSAPGGPNIYALGVSELIGLFDNSPDLTAEQRLSDVSDRLQKGKIKSGGHDDCRASAAFNDWMGLIAQHGDELKSVVKHQLGDRYDEEAASYVVGKANDVVSSAVYSAWHESALGRELGDEAGVAIEVTDNVPHRAKTFVRNKVDNTTIDQTRLYHISRVGEGSFVVDDPYVDDIEHVLSSGPDAAIKKVQAEHAREFIVAALVMALPNEELYQIDIVPS